MIEYKGLKISLFLGLVLTIITACNSDQVAWKTTEDGVFEYQHFVAPNAKPHLEFGDSVELHCILKQEGQELFSSYQNSKPARPIEIFIPDRMHRNKIEDLLVLMGEGDSLVAKVQYKEVKHELKEFGQNLNMDDELEIHYIIVAVKNREAIKQAQESRYAAKKGFKNREEMLQERAYIVEKSKWINDTLIKQQVVLNKNLKKAVDLDTIQPYYIEQGTGELPQKGQKAHIYYVLMLLENGKVLDDAYNRADRLALTVQQDTNLIKGLHQATLALKKGGKGTFLIPPSCAYGSEGSLPVVPANAWLMAYVELVELKD